MKGLHHDHCFVEELDIMVPSNVGTNDIWKEDDFGIRVEDYSMELLDLEWDEVGVGMTPRKAPMVCAFRKSAGETGSA